MHKKMLIAILGVVTLVGASIAGYMFGLQAGMEAGGHLSQVIEFEALHDRMNAEMAQGDCRATRSALHDYLALLDRYRDRPGSTVSGAAYHVDAMLTHARLARVDRVLGNQADAARHMQAALAACRQRRGATCDEASLIDFTDRLRKKAPIPCLDGSPDARRLQ